MKARVVSIDAVRGLIMVIMALDHVRDFIHRDAMLYNPVDLTNTTPLLFLTRWVTHVCAPMFMFCAGLGAFLWWQNGRTRRQLATFLLTRGLWLVALELVVMQLGYDFAPPPSYPTLLLVLWVLGLCMVAMAALVFVPVRWLTWVSIAAILLHNTLDRVSAASFGRFAFLWNVLHQPGAFLVKGHVFIVGYPLVPWVFVMALGFCCGQLYLMDAAMRKRLLLQAGLACTALFVVVRLVNRYGDPFKWSGQATATFSALSFLNTTKYPPSLAFLLMTLGPGLLLLWWYERESMTERYPLVVIGRVPLAYFVLHFFLAHVAALLLALARYGSDALHFMFQPVPSMGGPLDRFPQGFGYSLWFTYLAWAAVVFALYPFCRWYAGVKARRRDWWLSYL